MLFTAMLPDPEFAFSYKKYLCYSRRSEFFTTVGLGCAALVLLFSAIKYFGAGYLIYLGITCLLSKHSNQNALSNKPIKSQTISDLTSFRQGFFCNLLNPKHAYFS